MAQVNEKITECARELYSIVKALIFEYDEVTDEGQRRVDLVLKEARRVRDYIEGETDGRL
jgi:hypothetical protein